MPRHLLATATMLHTASIVFVLVIVLLLALLVAVSR